MMLELTERDSLEVSMIPPCIILLYIIPLNPPCKKKYFYKYILLQLFVFNKKKYYLWYLGFDNLLSILVLAGDRWNVSTDHRRTASKPIQSMLYRPPSRGGLGGSGGSGPPESPGGGGAGPPVGDLRRRKKNRTILLHCKQKPTWI